ncbi:hypothetical protein X801_07015, partial [Opisthorchis viverrini]
MYCETQHTPTYILLNLNFAFKPGAAFIDRPMDKEPGTIDSAADEITDSWTLEQLEDTDENSTLRVWDMDAEDSNSCPVHLEDSEFPAKSQVTATTTAPYRCVSDDPGDESENERDQLAVCDCLLALYDPESSKYGNYGYADSSEQLLPITSEYRTSTVSGLSDGANATAYTVLSKSKTEYFIVMCTDAPARFQ